MSHYSTITGGKKYYLCLYLFGPVVAERTQHKNVEREIKVHLIKELKCMWQFLFIPKAISLLFRQTFLYVIFIIQQGING